MSVHGFRSTFRDWAKEQTNNSRTVIEISMQHPVGSEVEQSYRAVICSTSACRWPMCWHALVTIPHLN